MRVCPNQFIFQTTNTLHRIFVGLMLVYRLRHWPKNKPVSTATRGVVPPQSVNEPS